MNLDDLTIGQAKELAAMISGSKAQNQPHPFVGKYVICRCYAAGVHAGYLVSQDGDNAVLRDSRRLWQWTANNGIALSGLSQHGLKSGKLDTLLPEIALTGVCETIPCSEEAMVSISEYRK